MTVQKSFKRLVRARMAKTGESYTAARTQLLAAGDEASTKEDIPQLVCSDERIRERTGRGWEEWFALLDSWDAESTGHTQIARQVAELLGIHPLAWDAQAVTTSFERARVEAGGRRAGRRWVRRRRVEDDRRPGRAGVHGVRRSVAASRMAAGRDARGADRVEADSRPIRRE